ncbi:hypothetical protein NQ317_016623 [Molorchus minor]|uniref:Tyr recombinase domain-containing protein n=1 Tax=Molorchus minor TaxID=1323400 RepID=A0ABQ9IUA6_9CUCU|nr:hypothetical protein NQ317_016623 [Molorchus minor]
MKYSQLLSWIILGIAGACRTDKLVNLTVDDIEDVGSSLIVKIPNTKTKIPRIFVVTDVGNMLELFRKYLSLRPPHVKHKRFFCITKQENVVRSQLEEYHGKNSSVVASYLKLPDVMLYWLLLTKIFSDITGRCWCGYHDNKASCWLEINDSR